MSPMMTAAQDGFDFGFDGSNYGADDDCEISIDFDSFFQILNESSPLSDPNLPADVFPSSDNSQECGSTAQLANHQDLLLRQDYCAMRENNAPKTETLEQLPSTSPAEIVLADGNHPSASNSSIESHMCQLPNFMETNYFPSTQDSYNKLNFCADVPDQNLLDDSNYDFMLTNGQMMSDNKGHGDDFWPYNSWPENKRALDAQVESANMSSSKASIYGFLGGIGPESMLNGGHSASTYDSSSSTTTDEASAETYMWGLMGQPCDNHNVHMKDQRNNEALEGFECMFSNADKGVPLEFSFASGAGGADTFKKTHEACYSVGDQGGAFVQYHIPAVERKPTHLQQLEKPVSSATTVPSSGNSCFKKKGANKMLQLVSVKSDPFRSTPKVTEATLSGHGNGGDDDDDDDICIIENMSQPSRIYRQVTQKKSLITPQRFPFTPKTAAIVPSPPPIGVAGIRQKASDERLIFQALVQDLSQPKSEATPPDGVLEVPLLRHQRIALSWMVQKETTSLQCSGGILADDQGLGKTVSTIALILTERPPSRELKEKALKLETLDLDEDADKSANQRTNGILKNGVEASPSKGRPSGGTLIVCPTSVLRQWAEELQNKVTSKAGLSVLVYHGSGRTKDPNEVAKFDVVLTTYSIVSMEVPRQSVNDKRNIDADDEPITSSRKRKQSSSSDKKQRKKGMENELIESRPLARVRWFRVVLDEAQSIKNFRTQVAQACWGLRAKRRWCLSGTPIQNAVDDLYSYFRFLKYDPYSVYNSFCSMVKNPISRNPSSGYRKLQAVLKTIMLRRTKGTRLDGKPIISLPPKSVKLMKVEFSEEERDFYSKLEADSRAQFLAYAESGTVKQNYVNILLLLLRLRQACDHPLLVQGFGSSSVVKSSIHMAKKLPQQQQIVLLNCLEVSLAICHICSDPPEDAVVSICGHVFCNQCVSEQLSGDDYQCPARNCKTQLSTSSVFSKATLKSCLSEGSCQGGTDIGPASESSERKESVEPAPFGHFDSSKLKAALEVLQSLSNPQVSASVKVCMESADGTSGLLVESSATPALDINRSDTSNDLGIRNSVVKEKAIVFSQWTRMLDMLEACLKECSIEYRRLDGTMSVVARDKAVKDFNTRPEVTVMIMSLKAASLGLNMVAACHVLLLDLWWNPTTEDQAIDRAHRIGQTRPVTVVRLTVKDTVEDRILALQQRKRRLVASAFGEDESGSRQTRLTVDDLKYLFMA